jgi:putative colanic acid biosynthesis acetyltransferase WcaF
VFLRKQLKLFKDMSKCIIPNTNSLVDPSFTFGNRSYRWVWGLIQLTVFRFSPRVFHRWRCFLLKIFGAKIGDSCHIYPGASIWLPKNLVLGDNVALGDGTFIYNIGLVAIGDRSIVSRGTVICTGTHDYSSRSFQLIQMPIKIGRDVWVCMEVFVHPGVEIADGVVVGARSNVTKSLLVKETVSGGNPCRNIKRRYSNEKS